MSHKVRKGFRAHNSKGVDKNGEKCNMGFDSDTFTKKMFKTAEKLKLDKNKAKNKMGFRAYNLKKGGQKWGKMQYNMGFGRKSSIYPLPQLLRTHSKVMSTAI